MAHGHWTSPVAWHYTAMGRLVADAGKQDWEELTAEYGAMLMEGLSVMGTRGKHVNVLQHLMGYLKNHLSSEDNAYLRYVGAAGAHRRLPAGAGAADRAPDVAAHRLKHHLNRSPPFSHTYIYY
jgi:hypothetical protein